MSAAAEVLKLIERRDALLELLRDARPYVSLPRSLDSAALSSARSLAARIDATLASFFCPSDTAKGSGRGATNRDQAGAAAGEDRRDITERASVSVEQIRQKTTAIMGRIDLALDVVSSQALEYVTCREAMNHVREARRAAQDLETLCREAVTKAKKGE